MRRHGHTRLRDLLQGLEWILAIDGICRSILWHLELELMRTRCWSHVAMHSEWCWTGTRDISHILSHAVLRTRGRHLIILNVSFRVNAITLGSQDGCSRR